MTNPQTPTSERSASYPRANGAAPRGPSGATTGWVRFGAVLMAVVGAFAVIEGFLAFFLPATYVSSNGVVVALTFTGWAWVHIILGALVLVVGLALLREDVPSWARNTGIVLVALNAITQLAWLPAAPIWSIIMIVLDVLIIGALVAIGDRAAWGE
jgi:hypothetical protein